MFIYIYIHVYTHVCTYTYICVCVYMNTHIYYIYTCTQHHTDTASRQIDIACCTRVCMVSDRHMHSTA